MGAMKTETCNMEKVPYIWRTVAPAVSVSMRPRFSPPSRLGARVWLHVRDVITILIIMQTIHTSFA